MTTALPELNLLPDAPAVAPDPHVSKIAPDDPRLRVRPARGRTLKKGPAIALVLALAGTLIVSLVFALLPSKPSDSKKAETESVAATPQAPLVPDTIRNAPDQPPIRLRDRALVPGGVLADGGLEFAEAPSSPPDYHAGSRRDDRVEQAVRARGSSILFETPHGATAGGAPTTLPTAAPPAQLGDRAAASPSLADADPNLQGRKNAFVDADGARKTTDTLQTRVRHPLSPYEIKAGAIIPAVLITAINSDLPGPVIGQVRENVYDTVSGNYLLVPQGSRLLAHYDSMVAWGQERVLVCWNRLVFPNGDSIDLECMPAADLAGAAGLTDDVNEHWMRILKGAAVASLLAATTQAVAGNTEGFNPTVPQKWANGAASDINQVGQQLTRRNLAIQPTISIRPGFSVNVIVTKDLLLPAPYSDGARSR